MDEEIHSMLALALVAGATAIETGGKSTEVFIFADKELSYREAAILLREKAVFGKMKVSQKVSKKLAPQMA